MVCLLGKSEVRLTGIRVYSPEGSQGEMFRGGASRLEGRTHIYEETTGFRLADRREAGHQHPKQRVRVEDDEGGGQSQGAPG